MTYIRRRRLKRYVRYLEKLSGGSWDCLRHDDLPKVLADGPAEIVRRTLSLDTRRKNGIFFTSPQLAKQLVSSLPRKCFADANALIMDPACGAGDLLIQVAKRLPVVVNSLQKTLKNWGKRLAGHDVMPEFIEITRYRLLLLAISRGVVSSKISPKKLRKLLPNITVESGLTSTKLLKRAAVIVMNPPYSQVIAPNNTEWAKGKVSNAAVFLSSVLSNVRNRTHVAAILPEVLRSGTRYEKWRSSCNTKIGDLTIKSQGVFDDHADIDVFILKCKVQNSASANNWTPIANGDVKTVAEYFNVHVGTLVPYRDSQAGHRLRYIHARNIASKDGEPPPLEFRNFSGRTFTPPFVVVRRTSRPGDKRRAEGVLIAGKSNVIVENHLLVCVPKDGSHYSCCKLIEDLRSEHASKWLDEAIKCRHITVAALGACPVSSLSDSEAA